MKSPTDMELVQRVAAGDTEAFGLVVERYSEPLYNLALRIVRDPALAEDVVQETFIRAYEHLDGFSKELERTMHSGLVPAIIFKIIAMTVIGMGLFFFLEFLIELWLRRMEK